MQTRSFRYFLEVARTGSISEASSQLRLSGSTISRQITKLEGELNLELFERLPRGMVLTPAGEILVKRLKRLSLETEAALEEVRAMSGSICGTIRIGSYEGFAFANLSQIMAIFRSDFPDTRFDLLIDGSAEICEKVSDGIVDIGITYNFAPPPNVQMHSNVRRPMYALMPFDHRLAGRDKLTMADLQGEAVAMTQRQLLDAALAVNRISLNPVLTTNSIATIFAFCLASKTIVLSNSPNSSFATSDKIAMVPVDDPALATSSIQIVTMSGRRLPSTIAMFVDRITSSIG